MLHSHKSPGPVVPHVNELVINWHITEACNYECQYCYAKWDGAGKELLHDWNRTRRLLDEIHDFFHPHNRANPLRQQLSWSSIRLNVAGGEPLLYPQALLRTLEYAKAKGMSASIITNGSRLTPDLIEGLAPLISTLGVSLDSANQASNLGMGRADSRGRLLDLDVLSQLLHQARQYNPALLLKVNTVVNALNHQEDLSQMLNALKPDRWKVLRMLQVVTQALAVSSAGFQGFVERHAVFRQIMCVEDNDDMSESYIMLDPLGRFFQNRLGQQGYQYSQPVDAVGAESAFSEWRLSATAFASRYHGMPLREVSS
ncbi:viperin family antiviral radical SAM protein [Pseudomonas sp. LPH60]|uniref:viperin family antiviral radical SAM protein n=1 Tax=Pseudomonas sp. LPH60 TaxID=3065906 RepID=UPI00273B7EF4|nr:viperin family antiviral radical SAM protein [Pseudomonas sp. LPH60]MDP4572934.1 viperin family antiviral radical SAM protein [Pseudomonas sp. LPH60]